MRERRASEVARARGRWTQIRAAYKFVALHHGTLAKSRSFDGPMAPSLADLPPLPPLRRPSLADPLPPLQRRPSVAEQAAAAPTSFGVYAVASVVLGTASVVPYNSLLRLDPGCPLFVSFVLHCAIVVAYLPRARELLGQRQIPLSYHLSIVVLGYTFNTLKAALTPAPTPPLPLPRLSPQP